jgi:hypothetical protein
VGNCCCLPPLLLHTTTLNLNHVRCDGMGWYTCAPSHRASGSYLGPLAAACAPGRAVRAVPACHARKGWGSVDLGTYAATLAPKINAAAAGGRVLRMGGGAG